MSETILVGALSLLGTIIGSFSGARLITYRIEQLEKKVEKHNNLIERTYKIESDIELLEERTNVLSNRLTNVEGR